MPVYRVDRTAKNGRTGGNLFWFIDAPHESVDELCEDLRQRSIITVDQLITEKGEPGFSIVTGRVTLGLTLQSVDCITIPNLRFVDGY